MYAVCMYSERLQILVSPDQRRQLEAEARRRSISVAAVIREAVQQHLGGAVDGRSREEAVARIKELRGTYHPIEELDRIVEDERSRP